MPEPDAMLSAVLDEAVASRGTMSAERDDVLVDVVATLRPWDEMVPRQPLHARHAAESAPSLRDEFVDPSVGIYSSPRRLRIGRHIKPHALAVFGHGYHPRSRHPCHAATS